MRPTKYEDITLFDFDKLCRTCGVKRHTYLTFEQKHNSAAPTIVLRFTGSAMYIMYNPNQIVLRGSDGELRFERVKYIRVYHTSDKGGLFYGVICDCTDRSGGETEYRLSATT